MTTSARLALLAGFVAMPGLASCAAAPRPVEVAGTYEIEVCNGPCPSATDSAADSTVRLRGLIVLLDSLVRLDALPEPSRWLLEIEWNVIADEGDGGACYHLDPTRPQRRDPQLAGTSAGVTRWRRHGDTLLLVLNQSPDSGWDLELTPTAVGYAGRLVSSGLVPGPTGLEWGGYIRGVRMRYLEPANEAVCVSVANTVAERFAHLKRYDDSTGAISGVIRKPR